MTPRYQYEELRKFAVRFMDDWQCEDGVCVYEPESHDAVELRNLSFFDEPVMWFCVPTPTPEQQGAAARLGFVPRKLAGEPPRDKVVSYFRTMPPDVDEVCGLCFSVLADVLGVAPERWLYITPCCDPDQWPIELPKPNPWPPAAA